MFFHTVFGILGSLINPFFHTLHLLLYVNISDSAMYILKAWVSKSGALINTLLLALFIIFAYSVLSANFYSDKFDIQDLDVCSSLASCYLYSLSYGLRAGGGLGDSMKPYDYGQDSKFGLKVLFDLSFFILINTIIMNIVADRKSVV